MSYRSERSMITNTSINCPMDHLHQHQSSNDNSTNAECREPDTHFKNATAMLPEKLFDFLLVTETHNVKQLLDSTENEEEPAFRIEAIPPSTSVILPANDDADKQQLTEAGKGVEQATGVENKNVQVAVVNGDQQNNNSINLQIQFIEQPTQIKRFKKPKPKTENLPQMEFDTYDEPPKLDEYVSEAPDGSTEFIWNNKTIPVNVNQFDKATLLGVGVHGSVHLVEVKELPRSCMVVKRMKHEKDENGRWTADTEWSTMKKTCSATTHYFPHYYCAVIDPRGDRQLCICMEWMDTSVLEFYQAMHLLKGITFNNLDCVMRRIVHDVVSALWILATKGIAHRDIKPANMLINKNAEIKLCDFGLSGNLTEPSLHRVAVGTDNYLAPNPKPCTIKGDMWALGMSLLEISSGQHPFINWVPGEKPFKILKWEPIVPTIVSSDMKQLILHLLKIDPEERPQSYDEILNLPFIRNASTTLSNSDRKFFRRVIKKTRKPVAATS